MPTKTNADILSIVYSQLARSAKIGSQVFAWETCRDSLDMLNDLSPPDAADLATAILLGAKTPVDLLEAAKDAFAPDAADASTPPSQCRLIADLEGAIVIINGMRGDA